MAERRQNKAYAIRDDVKIAIAMNGVSSMERYVAPDGASEQVLKSVTLSVPVGSVFGLTGEDRFALQLTSEIAGSLKPHEGGRCVLMELGMMRKKRRILPHLFYVNDQDVLYDHMQVLTYLMFACEERSGTGAKKQEKWLELMLETGSWRMALTYIGDLTPDERALVSLLAASETNARLVVADLSALDIGRERFGEYARLFSHMTKAGKTVFVANSGEAFTGRCCTHAALLENGRVRIADTVARLCQAYDHRLLTLYTPEVEKASALIALQFPQLRQSAERGRLKLYTTDDVDHVAVMNAVSKGGVRYEGVILGEKTLEEALMEVRRL